MARGQHQHDISSMVYLDSAYRSALAGLAGNVWQLEKCPSPLLSLPPSKSAVLQFGSALIDGAI